VDLDQEKEHVVESDYMYVYFIGKASRDSSGSYSSLYTLLHILSRTPEGEPEAGRFTESSTSNR
jgi:hypothetical protein